MLLLGRKESAHGSVLLGNSVTSNFTRLCHPMCPAAEASKITSSLPLSSPGLGLMLLPGMWVLCTSKKQGGSQVKGDTSQLTDRRLAMTEKP